MTPPAITPAGRSTTKRTPDGAKKASNGGSPRPVRAPGPESPAPPGHRRTLRQDSGPRISRRVSGPATARKPAAPASGRGASTARKAAAPASGRGPATARKAAATARTAAANARSAVPSARTAAGRTASAASVTTRSRTTTRRSRRASRSRQITLPALSWPRRLSGPARSARQGSARDRFVAAVRAVPDHPLLDRIVRGRAWIPLLGVMLAGIVAMQVEVLKLGATMGRALDKESTLQSRNELLRASVASLADDQRIERLAAAQGMVMPAPDAVGFLSAHRSDARRAAADIHAPDTGAFLSNLTSNGTVATTPAPIVPVTSSSSSQTGTGTQSTTGSTSATTSGG